MSEKNSFKASFVASFLEQYNRPGFFVYEPTVPIHYQQHQKNFYGMSFEDVDRRAHGWCDVITKNKDGRKNYYKFLSLGDRVYKGWLKKWQTLGENHYVIVYGKMTDDLKCSYTIDLMKNFRLDKFCGCLLPSENGPKYSKAVEVTSNYYQITNVSEKECLILDFNNEKYSMEKKKKIEWLLDHIVDNVHEYLLYMSKGYVYMYKETPYCSLKQLYDSVYNKTYKTYKTFESAFYRGSIKEIEKKEKNEVFVYD